VFDHYFKPNFFQLSYKFFLSWKRLPPRNLPKPDTFYEPLITET